MQNYIFRDTYFHGNPVISKGIKNIEFGIEDRERKEGMN